MSSIRAPPRRKTGGFDPVEAQEVTFIDEEPQSCLHTCLLGVSTEAPC